MKQALKTAVSAGIEATLQLIDYKQPLGFQLIPVTDPIRQDWWALALLLGVAGATVGVQTFKTQGVSIRSFSLAVVVLLLAALPFIGARYVHFGVAMTMIALVAYLVLHAVTGLIVGGVVVTLWKN